MNQESKTCSQQLAMGIGVWNVFSEDNPNSLFCDGSELENEKQKKWFPYIQCQKSNCEGCPMEYLPVVSPSCYSKLDASGILQPTGCFLAMPTNSLVIGVAGAPAPSAAKPVHLNRYVYKPVGEASISPPTIPNVRIVLFIGDSVDRKVVESYCVASSTNVTVWSVDRSSREKGFENSAICIPNDDRGKYWITFPFLPTPKKPRFTHNSFF